MPIRDKWKGFSEEVCQDKIKLIGLPNYIPPLPKIEYPYYFGMSKVEYPLPSSKHIFILRIL